MLEPDLMLTLESRFICVALNQIIMSSPTSSKPRPRNRAREFVIKFRHILGPVIILWWSAVLIYGACCWVCIHFHLNVIKQEIWEVLLPFMLALGVVGIMGRRLKILPALRVRSWRDFVGMLVGVTSVAMMMLTQEALSHHLAQVTRLTVPDSLLSCPETTYYQLDTVEIEKTRMGYALENRLISRRAGMDRVFELYVVFPFRGQETVWYALSFKDHIHLTLLSGQDEKTQYRRFLQRCEQQVMHYDFGAKHFFKRVAFSEDYDGFRDAVRQEMGSGEGESLQRLVFLEPMDRLPQDRSRLNLIWIGGSFLIGLFLTGVSLFFIPLDFTVVRKDGRFRKNQPTKSEFWEVIQEAIWPTRENWPRAILPFMLLLVYIVMVLGGVDVFAPSGQDLLRWGGVQHAALERGEWWRLFTSVFVHGGIMHLLSNEVALCIAIWVCGTLFGPYKPLGVFLISGMGSAWITTCFSKSILVGASGGIMGLIASVLVIYVFYPAKRVPRVGGWLLWMILGGTLLVGMLSGISNLAHVAGLGIGAVLGLLWFRPPSVSRKVARRNKRPDQDEK